MMIAFLKFWTVFKISRPLQIAAGVLARSVKHHDCRSISYG